MLRALATLSIVLTASAALAQTPPAAPGGSPPPAAPIGTPVATPGAGAQATPGGAHLPTPGSGAPAAPQLTPELIAQLAAWEQVMQGANNFYCKDVKKVTKNMLTGKETTLIGEIRCL